MGPLCERLKKFMVGNQKSLLLSTYISYVHAAPQVQIRGVIHSTTLFNRFEPYQRNTALMDLNSTSLFLRFGSVRFCAAESLTDQFGSDLAIQNSSFDSVRLRDFYVDTGRFGSFG